VRDAEEVCDSFFGALRGASDRFGFRVRSHFRPASRYWSSSCVVDVHLPDFDERIRRAYGTEEPFIGVASSVEWVPDDGKLWGEVLVPMCSSEPGQKFFFTPHVDLSESCVIEQVHCHSGAVPTCHIHFSCDMKRPGSGSVENLFGKLGDWLGRLNEFSRSTCGASGASG